MRPDAGPTMQMRSTHQCTPDLPPCNTFDVEGPACAPHDVHPFACDVAAPSALDPLGVQVPQAFDLRRGGGAAWEEGLGRGDDQERGACQKGSAGKPLPAPLPPSHDPPGPPHHHIPKHSAAGLRWNTPPAARARRLIPERTAGGRPRRSGGPHTCVTAEAWPGPLERGPSCFTPQTPPPRLRVWGGGGSRPCPGVAPCGSPYFSEAEVRGAGHISAPIPRVHARGGGA